MNGHVLSRVFRRSFPLRIPSKSIASASEPRYSNHDEFTTRAEEEAKAKERLRQVRFSRTVKSKKIKKPITNFLFRN
jgi:hypothetical protein